mmetsp:Transcript_7641/g.11347  ORF Transcript_7641/g.11347 Transcript_7641/m.11347 type:complete len:323 (+) Transcript_7641:19-987(+)
MFIELSLPIEITELKEGTKELQKLIKHCQVLISFGWDGVVLNQMIDKNTIKQVDTLRKAFRKLLKQLREALKPYIKEHGKNTNALKAKRDKSNATPDEISESCRSFQIFSRFTLRSDIVNFERYQVAEEGIPHITAILPVKDDHFSRILEKSHFDVVCINSIASLIYVRKKLKMASKNKLAIELSYGPAFADESQFMSFFCRMKNVLQFVNSESFVLSSNLNSIRTIRAPYDIANLAGLFGFDYAVGKHMISSAIVNNVLAHANQRSTIHGVTKFLTPSFFDKVKNVHFTPLTQATLDELNGTKRPREDSTTEKAAYKKIKM